LKSIRGIYISLIKVLHPDAELDISRKQEKENIIKKVTVAYENKDLPTLLKLELEWVHKTTEHLDEISEDKLKLYISVLRNRAEELEFETIQLYTHPKYEPIEDVAMRTEKACKKYLEKDKINLEIVLERFKNNLSVFKLLTSKKDITSFIEDMHFDLSFVDDEEDDFAFPF
jgi:hypothetical protein